MTSRYKVMLLWTIWSTCKVVTKSNEVVLVNRNVTDSFLVGIGGCKNNTSVCTNSATCQNDSGLCLCSTDSPNFINHVETGFLEYGCVKTKEVYTYIGGLY